MKLFAQQRKVDTELCGTHSFITVFTGAHKSTQLRAKENKPKPGTIFNEYIRFTIVLLSTVYFDLRRTLLSSDCAHFNPIRVTAT